PMIRGMFWIRFWVYSISSRTSQGPAQISVSSMTSRRGRKLSVCSLICVAAWNIATTRPTSRLGTTSTPTMVAVSHRPPRNRSTATSGVIARLLVLLPLKGAEAAGKRADDQPPAVDQHEQHDLERQRND